MNPNIAARLAERASRHPDRPAVIEGRGRRRRVVTFGELAERVARTGHRLRDLGLRPGDRALLFVPMSAELYVWLLGVLHAGGVAVFLDAWAGRGRLETAVAAAAPLAFIGTWKAHLLRVVSPALRHVEVSVLALPGGGRLSRALFHLGHREWDGETEEGGAGDGFGGAALVEAEDHALVTFTTGSTGRPKAAARSHGFLWAQHLALARHLDLREDDIDMPTLPVFVLNNLALGVTTVLPALDPRRPADIRPGTVLSQMREEGVTTTSGSPAFYDRLASHAAARGQRIPVRALYTGGAPVFPPLARQLESAVDGVVHVLYGSTEAEPIAGISAAELARRSEAQGAVGVCAGRPVPEVAVRIVRPMEAPVRAEDLPRLEAAPGVAGEILVAGDHVLAGYLNDPDAEALHKVRDGDRVWHRTGDGGRLDEEGRLWLLGRVAQRVVRSDGTWWPMAAEAQALMVPGVRHCAYVGVVAPGAGAGVTAVLCLEVEGGEGASQGLAARVRTALAPIPVDEVRVLKRIPRDPRHASKTDVVALRKALARSVGRPPEP